MPLLLGAASRLLRRQQALLLERVLSRGGPEMMMAAGQPSQQQQGHQQQQRAYLAPPVTRDPRFARLRDDDLAFFRDVLGEAGVVTGEDALEPYNRYGRTEKTLCA